MINFINASFFINALNAGYPIHVTTTNSPSITVKVVKKNGRLDSQYNSKPTNTQKTVGQSDATNNDLLRLMHSTAQIVAVVPKITSTIPSGLKQFANAQANIIAGP